MCSKLKRKTTRVLALSSPGGHWVQLQRITRRIDNCELIYASVGQRPDLLAAGIRYYSIPDATRWDRVKLIWMAVRVTLLVLWLRPDVVISTGAAPGFAALRIGKLIGSRCLWIDSIANVEEVSLSGRKVAPYADLCLTQWPHLANNSGFQWMGSVLTETDP